jgi:hypothetical protein
MEKKGFEFFQKFAKCRRLYNPSAYFVNRSALVLFWIKGI